MDLRPYQVNLINAVHESWKESDRVIAVAPTGSGKAVMMACIARDRLEHGPVLILAHRQELIDQAIDKMEKATGVRAVKEMAESKASGNERMVVASMQTLSRRDVFGSGYFRTVIVDECHHLVSDSYLNLMGRFTGAKVLGVTATPDRSDKKELGSYFEKVAYEIGLLDLIAQGYLSKIVVNRIPVRVDLSNVSKRAGEFASEELDSAITPWLEKIVAHIPRDRKTLVFLPLIATSKQFTEIAKGAGFDAEHVDGNSPDRADVLARFAAKKVGILSNSMLLTEGYDCPSIDCVLVLRPTMSRPLYSQMIGRGTRIFPGKENLLVLDALWLTGKHSLVRPTSLVTDSVEVAKIAEEMLDQGEMWDVEKVVESAKEQREKSLIKQLKEQAAKAIGKKLNAIDPLEFAVSLHDARLAEYEPVMAWESAPPSPKQVQMIERFGLAGDRVTCKGHASAIINRIMDRQRLKLASPKQLKWLIKLGHPKPYTETFKGASEFLDKQFNKQK